MTEIRVQNKCGRCNGTGIDDNKRDAQGNPIPESCTTCAGDGWLEAGKIDITDLTDKLNDIQDKIQDIWEKINE